MTRQAQADGAPQALIALMMLTLFLDFVGLTMAIPFLPRWAERLGAGPATVGVLATAYALAQLTFTPVLGTLSDRHGRKPVILASLVLSAASFALTAVAASVPALFVARVVGGLGAANVGAAQAVVSDLTPPSGRARAMGTAGAAIGFGHVTGPVAAGSSSGSGRSSRSGSPPRWRS